MDYRRGGRWFKDAVILAVVLAVMVILGLGFARLVEEGRPGRQEFRNEVARAFSDAVEASIRGSSRVRDDKTFVNLTETMQTRLEAGLKEMSGEADFPEIRVLIIESETVNALAFPGNLVIIYTGLIELMEEPEDLAAVLAHEIGHCVNKDSRNALIRELGISVLVSASGAGGAGELAGEILRGALRMKYGRRAEERADRFAVDLLDASNLDPLSYAEALEALDAYSDNPEWAKYMDVHPPMSGRIADARRRAGRLRGTRPGYQTLEVEWDAVIASLGET